MFERFDPPRIPDPGPDHLADAKAHWVRHRRRILFATSGTSLVVVLLLVIQREFGRNRSVQIPRAASVTRLMWSGETIELGQGSLSFVSLFRQGLNGTDWRFEVSVLENLLGERGHYRLSADVRSDALDLDRWPRDIS